MDGDTVREFIQVMRRRGQLYDNEMSGYDCGKKCRETKMIGVFVCSSS